MIRRSLARPAVESAAEAAATALAAAIPRLTAAAAILRLPPVRPRRHPELLLVLLSRAPQGPRPLLPTRMMTLPLSVMQ